MLKFKDKNYVRSIINFVFYLLYHIIFIYTIEWNITLTKYNLDFNYRIGISK